MKKWNVHAVLFKEGDWWVGQWLEYEVAAQAKTVKDLIHELLRTLAGHALINMKNGRSEFANLGRAPEKFWEMYEQGMKIEPPKAALKVPEELPSLEPELHLVA